MTTGPSPEDILHAILSNIGPIVIILLAILGSIGKAMKGSAKPPSGAPGSAPRPIPPAPPASIPRPTASIPRPATTVSPPMAATQPGAPSRPAGQPKFRAQAQPVNRQASSGASSDQLAQKRADIERFVRQEKKLASGEPAPLDTPLTSSSEGRPAQNALFAPDGPIAGEGANANLLRAIMLAQALGPPRARGGRGRIPTP